MTATISKLSAAENGDAEHHKRNCQAIMTAGNRDVIMRDRGSIARRFGKFKKCEEVISWIRANPNANAWVLDTDSMKEERCPGFVDWNDRQQSRIVPLPNLMPPSFLASEVGQESLVVPKAIVPRSEFAAEVPETLPMKKPRKPPVVVAPNSSLNEHLTVTGQLMWPDVKKTEDGFVPRATCANARVAILALRLECRQDLFHGRLLVDGHHIEQWAGELSDHACQMLRVLIRKHFGFDPGRENIHDAAIQLCIQNSFDPVVDYLGSLSWDGKLRLDTWLIDYLGAPDTEINRAFGRLVLLAAVKRARNPGCKFDQILVLEGREGTQKSTAIAIMAGLENFSDQTILGLDEKRQMELIAGRWLYEIADLAGMKRSEVEAVKAFAARTVDRGRPAYGRHVIDQPRRCVFIATTNDDSYLKSQTGNRRFWPVKTGKIAINALKRDRDQLWAEAAQAEAAGEAVVLPERLWAQAAVEQDKRLEHDPWDDILENAHGELHHSFEGDEYRVASCDLINNYLKIPPDRQTKEGEKKLAQCMRRLGWHGPEKIRIRAAGSDRSYPQRGYRRPAQSPVSEAER